MKLINIIALFSLCITTTFTPSFAKDSFTDYQYGYGSEYTTPLNGVWVITYHKTEDLVTPAVMPETMTFNSTFTPVGGLISSSNSPIINVFMSPDAQYPVPLRAGEGHGRWKRTGATTFSLFINRMIKLAVEPYSFAGWGRGRADITVDPVTDEVTGTLASVLIYPDGTEVELMNADLTGYKVEE